MILDFFKGNKSKGKTSKVVHHNRAKYSIVDGWGKSVIEQTNTET